MAREPEFVLNYIKELELLAHDVISDRRDIVELNKKRDKTREATRAIQKMDKTDPVWLCTGNLFMSFNSKEANLILNKDFDQLDKQINVLNSGLKDKVNRLNEAENKPEVKGSNIVAMSHSEKQSLFDLIGK